MPRIFPFNRTQQVTGQRSRVHEGDQASPADPGAAAARRCFSAVRRTMSVESIVAIAVALTLAATFFREPLTSDNLVITPALVGSTIESYTFDDRTNGGASRVAADSKTPLKWTCALSTRFAYPYCGFGVSLDAKAKGHGLDLSGYESIDLKLDYEGAANAVRVLLKDQNPQYLIQGKSVDKPNQASFPVRKGGQVIPMNLADFGVADWWKEATRAAPKVARPSFGNIVAFEIVTGADSGPGVQRIQIRQMTFHHHWISAQAWFGAIALCWLALIVSMLLYRRRQIEAIQRAGETALRESERLYRGILESTSDAVIVLDPAGDVRLVNNAGIAAMEFGSAEEVAGRHWTRIWRGESTEAVGAALNEAAKGKTSRFRVHCATSAGTPKWWDVVVAPILCDSGALKALLTTSRDITGEREKSDQLKWASEHDALTYLPNRRAFQSRLQAAILRAMKNGQRVGLLVLDLDHFKHVNDSLGHSAGDALLKAIAERLRGSVRNSDLVARIGGDEFAVLIEEVSSAEDLLRVGNEILSLILAPVRADGRTMRAGASIGGAIFPDDAASANELFKSADTALYSLKQNGRGGTRLFDLYMLEEADKAASQLRLARGALTRRSVVPVYQPKFMVDGGGVTGFEALLRWRHPRKGLQLPGTLEEAFSDYDIASKIGEFMQNSVARDIRSWLDGGCDFGRVAINAAPAEFLRDDYAERLLEVLSQHQVPPTRIEIEITEHAFLGRATEYVARALSVLKRAGVTVSLDDFGTGCSSLSHLRDFPVDLVKIDMSFVQKMAEDKEIAAIVSAVINLARSLSIGVVAEGVETPAQLDLLRSMGCHMVQGHLFAAALEAKAVTELVPVKRAAA